MGMSFISLMLLLRLSLTTADLLSDVKCEDDPLGYVVPDPTYCDRYLECGPGPGGSIQLCTPGQALDLQTGFCQVEAKVDCSTREMRYQKERAKLTAPVRRFHSRGGQGPLSRGSHQVNEKNLSRGGPSQVTERHPTTTAPLPPVTEARLGDEEKRRPSLFGSRRRPSILSSDTTTTRPEIVSTTPKVSSRPKPFTRNTGGEEESSKTNLYHRQSSFTKSGANTEDVASVSGHFNDATTTNPPRRGPFTRINNPTRNTDGEEESSNTKLFHRQSSLTQSRVSTEDVASAAEHFNDAATTNPPRRGLFTRINNPTRSRVIAEDVAPITEHSIDATTTNPPRRGPFTRINNPTRSRVSPEDVASATEQSIDATTTNPPRRGPFSRITNPSRPRVSTEDVASTTENFNDATTNPPRRSPFIRITNPTRRPLLRTPTTSTSIPSRRTSYNILLKPVTEGTSLDDLACAGSEEYIVPDPTHCDRYLSCPDRKIILCLTGMVLDTNLGFCQRKSVTDCEGRKLSFREAQEEEEQTRRIEEEMSEIMSATTKATVESSRKSYFRPNKIPTPLQPIIEEVFEDETYSKVVSTDPFLALKCEAGAAEYVVPDSTHCDRYLSCPEGQVEICQRGLVVNLDTGFCTKRRHTDCTGREKLFRNVDNALDVKLDEKIRKLEEDSRLKSRLSRTRNGAKEVSKPIRPTLSPAPTSKAVSSHSPGLIPSFEVDAADSGSRSSSGFAFPSRSSPISPSVSAQQVGILARNPASSSSESIFSRITVSKPSSSDDTNPGRPLQKSSSSLNSFSRIQVAKPGASDDANPGRPILSFNPVSTTTTTTTTTTPPASVDPLSELICEQSEAGYIVPDPVQCDRFAECSLQGEKFYKLCPKGLVLSLTKGVCDYPEQVDCSDRPELQSSLGKGQCPRQNGQFIVATDTSCRQYVDCRGGEGLIKNCGVGQLFDENLGCVHPDQSTRHGCSALDPNEFQCPTGLRQKFGDHDRLSHPTDCKLFYSCQKNGQKRLLGCQKPAVFNPETGLCDAQENVPGCEEYYVQEVVGVDKEERSKIAQEIREQLIKEFGLGRRT